MTLPEFQNRGIAGQAVREVLGRARTERRFGQLHAFPAVTNPASNRICEKNAFANLGPCGVEFAGRQPALQPLARPGLLTLASAYRFTDAIPASS
jgi:hypothetical protein